MKIGEKASPGDVYTLLGDLGVGKTVFTQGVAKGLGIKETVNSPTFTILQIYEEGRLPFYHFDVYRIGCVEEMDKSCFGKIEAFTREVYTIRLLWVETALYISSHFCICTCSPWDTSMPSSVNL